MQTEEAGHHPGRAYIDRDGQVHTHGSTIKCENTECGAPNGANVSVVEEGDGIYHRTTITLAAQAIVLADEAGVVLYGGLKVYDFPAGVVKVLGAVANLTIAVAGNLSATAAGDFGLGTATAGNNNALAGTEQNIIPTTEVGPLVGSAGTAKGANVADIAPLDGHTTPVDLYLNHLWDDTDHNGGTMTVSGTIVIHWLNLGDY